MIKKLFLTILFTLVLCGGAYAKDIILECKLINLTSTTYDKTVVYSAQELNSPINFDNVYKINSKSKTILSYNRYRGEFQQLSRDVDDFEINWSENEINWTFKTPIIQGASSRDSLNRNTGKLIQKIFFEKTSNTYKNTGISYSKSVSQCQKRDKFF